MKGKKVLCIFCVFMIFLGVGVALYPLTAQLWAQQETDDVLVRYGEAVQDLSAEEIHRLWKEAEEYNKQGHGYWDTYPDQLRIEETGIMGELIIPKILVDLPIYHGTEDEVLEKGIGHLANTSLPTGGISTHIVLCGHSGLPSLYAFDRLDELAEGDEIYLQVLDRRIAYVVREARTVLPEEAGEYLVVTEEKSELTLVTCTPYGVNTHRLLIQASRKE